jgi:transposase, IS5 family
MLRLAGGQVESLFDELLPLQVQELPAELAVLDRLLADPRLLAPIEQAWAQTARRHGRPTIPMGSFVRLLVVKQRTGWGYETLVREVSDSLHLRRFCLLPLTQRVPEESTVRKLVCRLGPEVVAELTRVVIGKAQRETRFAARAVRIDSTVVEADIRYPADGVLALQGARVLARQGRKLAGRLRRPTVGWWIGRGGSASWCGRSPRRWPGGPASAQARSWHSTPRRGGRWPARSGRRGRWPRRRARPRVGVARRPSCARLGSWMTSLTAASGSSPRSSSGSVGSGSATGWYRLSDPDARPIRKGKLGKPNEFGYVVQVAEVTASTRRGARGFVLPAATAPGNPGENRLLEQTAAELDRLGLRPREVALDGGFVPGPTAQTLARLAPTRMFISGRAEPGSRRTRKRLARYRTGCEGRISHLKRGYGLRRSRLRGDQGQRIWTGWAILAYNLDTLAIHTS